MRAVGLIRRGVRAVYGSRMVGRSSFWYGGYERGEEEVVRGEVEAVQRGKRSPYRVERNSGKILNLTCMAVWHAISAEEGVPLSVLVTRETCDRKIE